MLNSSRPRASAARSCAPDFRVDTSQEEATWDLGVRWTGVELVKTISSSFTDLEDLLLLEPEQYWS